MTKLFILKKEKTKIMSKKTRILILVVFCVSISAGFLGLDIIDTKNFSHDNKEDIRNEINSDTVSEESYPVPILKNESLASSGSISTIFSEDFEWAWLLGLGDWHVGDWNDQSGQDYFGITDRKANGGSWSVWCAQEGQNSYYGGYNRDLQNYDDNQNSFLLRNRVIDLSAQDLAYIDFYAWYETESPYDYLAPRFYTTSSSWAIDYSNKLQGSSTSWNRYYWRFPTQYMHSQAAFGFNFFSDYSICSDYGVALDDIKLVSADITIESCYLSTSSVWPGETVTLNYQIHNPTPFSISVGLGASLYHSNYIDDSSNDVIVNVPSGYSFHSREFNIPSDAPSGVYDLHYGLWSGNPGDTSNGNRIWDTKVKSNELTVKSKPDIIIEELSLSVNPTGDHIVTISAVIKNQGGSTASSFYVKFLSDYRGNYGQEKDLGNVYIDSLGSGLSTTIYKVTSAIAPGNHILEAHADYNNRVDESNTQNNWKWETFYFKGVNLVVEDIWWDTSLESGKKIWFRIKNTGDGDLEKEIRSKLFIDGIYHSYSDIDELRSGYTREFYTSYIQLAAGLKHIKIIVDANNDVLETNENDNERSENMGVTSLFVYIDNSDNQDATVEFSIDGSGYNWNLDAPAGSCSMPSQNYYIAGNRNHKIDYRWYDEETSSWYYGSLIDYVSEGSRIGFGLHVDFQGPVSISGSLKYYNENAEEYQPIRFATVEIYAEGGLWAVASTWTDSEGNYEFNFLSGIDQRNLFLKIYSDCDAVKVHTGGLLQNSHCFQSPMIYSDSPNINFDVNFDQSEENLGAWNIYHRILDGNWFICDFNSGEAPPKVFVVYYKDYISSKGCSYYDGQDTIHISGGEFDSGDELDDSVILTTYGYFIHQKYGGRGELNIDYQGDGHYWNSHENPETAFSEGFAHAFSGMVRHYFYMRDNNFWLQYHQNPHYYYIFSDARLNADLFINLESTWFSGSSDHSDVEGAIGGILYDIYDPRNDDVNGDSIGDILSLGFTPIWWIMTEYDPEPGNIYYNHPHNIDDFKSGFNNYYEENYRSAIIKLYYEHGINRNHIPYCSVSFPNGNEILSGSITINVDASDEDGDIECLKFLYSVDDSVWYEIGIDENPDDGWSIIWNSEGIDEHSVWVKVEVMDSLGVSAFDVTDQSFAVYNSPDLIPQHLYTSDLMLNQKSEFSSGQPIVISVEIVNNAPVAVGSGFYMDIYIDEERVWRQYYSSLSGLEDISVEFDGTFVSDEGTHTVEVIVDPFNQISELSELNNHLSTQIEVVIPEFLVLAYQCADNNLESYCLDDYNDLKCIGSSSEITFISQIDRIDGYDSRYGDWNGCERFYIEKGLDPTVENSVGSLGEINMGAETTFVDFINWASQRFKANRHILILENHGATWLGCCFDSSSSNDVLDLHEISTGLSAYNSINDDCIDILLMDDCLMGAIEVAYELSPYVNYQVSAESVGWTNTWPYHTFSGTGIFDLLASDPSITSFEFAKKMVELATLNDNANHVTTSIAAYNLSLIDDLHNVFEEFSYSLINNMHNYREEFRDIRDTLPYFIGPYSGQVDRILDLYNLIAEMSQVPENSIQDAADSIHDILGLSGGRDESFIIKERHTPTCDFAHGLSIYFPNDPSDFDNDYFTSGRFVTETIWPIFLEQWYDDNPPEIYSIQINNGDSYTNNARVSINLDALDNLELKSFCISTDGLEFSNWLPYEENFEWIIPKSNGVQYIIVKIRDSSGLITTGSDSIIFDGSNPFFEQDLVNQNI
ncbi:MAG: hypothetical protein GF364_20515, partial [Candidatus Lokiarchaeota archaeon]|nr:hypothetical protein [Candidatus Lokiarchaeota archaeon]